MLGPYGPGKTCHQRPSIRYHPVLSDCTVIQAYALTASAHQGADAECYTSHRAYRCQCVSLMWCSGNIMLALMLTHGSTTQQGACALPAVIEIVADFITKQQSVSRPLLQICCLGPPMSSLLHRQSAAMCFECGQQQYGVSGFFLG